MSEDRIDWVTGKPRRAFAEYALWLEAVERAANGDSAQLIVLLRSGPPPGPDSRLLIAKLLEGRVLKRKRGRQADLFRTSPIEARLNNLRALVRYFRRKGYSPALARQEALREERREALRL